ncbi:MAG TPA: helix-hairpin-helix domain-containing protein [Polyangia bacterium]|nr:helix-hairpin-helix domain-containing protein [Polyangia bacterium]
MRRATPLLCHCAVAILLSGGRAWAAKAIDGVVNLNTAPAGVLSLLPGVGPSKAAAIVVYRARRPFRTVDELVRIKGIGRKMVRRLRPHLAVSGPTTAAASTGSATPASAAAPAPAVARARPPPAEARCPAPQPPSAARRARGEPRDLTPRRAHASPCLGDR